MHRYAILALLISFAACNRSQDEEPDIHAAKTDPSATAGGTGATRQSAELMPGDRGETEADRAITQRVRQNLTNQGSLASISRSIDVVTANAIVTLRGSVRTAEERLELARIAQGSEGVKEVVNQLGIAGFEIVGE
jgi:osmotically-inducible protein OsmY